MKNNRKLFTHLFAFALTLVMLFSTLSPIFAVTITTDKEQLTGADIVSEDESKREEFSKHYLTGDGTYCHLKMYEHRWMCSEIGQAIYSLMLKRTPPTA